MVRMSSVTTGLKSVLTSEELYTTTITWEIDQVATEPGSTSSSAIFSHNDYPCIKWRLEHSYNNRTRLANIALCLVASDQLNFACILDGCLLKKEFTFTKQSQVFSEVGQKMALPEFEPQMYLVNGKLTLRVLVKPLLPNIKPFPISLNEDLGRLLENDSGDVTLSVGGEKLKVHMLIVRARSPVLAAMLDGDETDIPDVDLDLMKQVVRFIYTDTVSDIKTNARKLVPVACKFALLGLKALCEKSIRNSLTVENAAQTLVLADGLSMDLRTWVIEFMKKHFNEIKSTAGFKSMVSTHPHLLTEVCCVVLDVNATPGTHVAA